MDKTRKYDRALQLEILNALNAEPRDAFSICQRASFWACPLG